MRKFSLCFFLLSFALLNVLGQQQYRKPVMPTKNLILMIPDGTSIGVVSAARWYQIYNNLGGDRLAVDPYICGTVKTFSSNAPIGDSAPTTSCYMTGMQQREGNVAVYPLADTVNDLVSVNPSMAYQPLATILEAAKYQQNKAVGLVVTVEFPHATPADCSAHYYDRNNYGYIASQMAYQNLDVMFGGGNSIITDDIKQYLRNTGTTLVQDDIEAFRSLKGKDKAWALFCEREHPYDLDRDTTKIPSLAEMTEKALEKLSQNENGFFLMVEGSKVDWSAHGNDAIGCITEYLAFDKAVALAMDFAKNNGETTIVILPDHGNSGFTIGNKNLNHGERASISTLFGKVSEYKKTGYGLSEIILNSKPEDFRKIFKEYANINLTDDEYNAVLQSIDYKKPGYTEIANSLNVASVVINIMNSRTYFGFTSGNHTGEEVFLAAYHPQGNVPMGMNTNAEINQYLFDVLGLKKSLPTMTSEIFAKHTDVFAGMDYWIDKSASFPILKVKEGGKVLSVPAFKSLAYINGQSIPLNTVTVYIDKNDTFYLPQNLRDKF